MRLKPNGHCVKITTNYSMMYHSYNTAREVAIEKTLNTDIEHSVVEVKSVYKTTKTLEEIKHNS